MFAHSQRDVDRQRFSEPLTGRMRDATPARPPGAWPTPTARRELELLGSSHDFGTYCRDEVRPDIGQLTDAEPIPRRSAEAVTVLCALRARAHEVYARGRFASICSVDRTCPPSRGQAEAGVRASSRSLEE